MSKEAKQRKVRYVVGDNLGSPVVVEHFVDDMINVVSEPMVMVPKGRGGSSGNPKHRAKRHCGQSQRSARDAKKQREKK